jgi:hypothetical protein
MPSFNNDDHLFAPVSVYRLHPASVTPGADWLYKPGDYNKGELKGNTPNFVQPVKPSVIHYDIPDELAVPDPFKGLAATMENGYDWYRHPEQYNKGALEGLPGTKMARLVPSHTKSYKVDHFEAHFKMQNKIHPEANLANAIPEAHANYQQKKMDEHLRKAEVGAYVDEEELERLRTSKKLEKDAPISEFNDEVGKYNIEVENSKVKREKIEPSIPPYESHDQQVKREKIEPSAPPYESQDQEVDYSDLDMPPLEPNEMPLAYPASPSNEPNDTIPQYEPLPGNLHGERKQSWTDMALSFVPKVSSYQG